MSLDIHQYQADMREIDIEIDALNRKIERLNKHINDIYGCLIEEDLMPECRS